MMTEVAIVILNWNGKDYLEKFLPALTVNTQKDGWEIIVADNNSEDESIEFLTAKYPFIKIIKLDKNYGFAAGYNRALNQIKAKYFLLLNSDIEVTENWLAPMVEFLNTHDSFAACSPILLNYNNKSAFEYAGAAGGYIDKYGYTFCRGRIFNKVESAEKIPGHSTEVFWTTGACMLIRSDLYKEAGGFDNKFFAHMEEVDLCWRLKNRGYKFAVVPQARVYHVGGGTLPKTNPFKTYLNYRNNLYLLYKNLPDHHLHKILRRRFLLDGVSSLMFLLTFQWKNLTAVRKAHVDFRKNKKEYEKFRSEHKLHITNIHHPEIYSKSIVLDYFFLGNKTFSKLRGTFAEKMDMQIIKQNERKKIYA